MTAFALIGAAGFVAPRHMDAIRHVGGTLVAALDPHDSVGVLDRHFPDCRFFTSPERFDRWLNKNSGHVDYVSVCSPNWLHDAHCRWALRSGADAICEKPVVLRPWNVDQLAEIEWSTGRRIHPVLQLRFNRVVLDLAPRVERWLLERHVEAHLTYVTRRGRWYAESWKGDPERSGGLLTNLGIHFFDLACMLFGIPRSWALDPSRFSERMSGRVDFDRASLAWMLSTREEDLPDHVRSAGGHAHRRLLIGGESVDFSEGFHDLHRRVYEEILADRAPRLVDARPAIELVHNLRELA